ncbi:MAG: hypothetical protein HKN71_10960 [Gemmatimonadetes bacterium]|nr:hypothetical protein [Gemmatimonadota bacterium]
MENGRGALHALKANVARFRLKGRARIFRSDAFAFIEGIEDRPYDLCVADPPYTSSLAERVARIWFARPFSKILAIEHDEAVRLPNAPRGVRRNRIRVDRSAVTLYRAS